MEKKKIIAALALASVLAVGTGVATISFGNGTEVLATGETTTDVVTGKAIWEYKQGEDNSMLVTENGNYKVPLEIVDKYDDQSTLIGREVKLNGKLQKIKSITFTLDKEGGTVYADPEYCVNVETGEMIVNNKVNAVNNIISFKEGHYPCKFKAVSDKGAITKMVVDYVCNKNEEIFDAPVVESGWYIVGTGSFVKPGEGHDWNSEFGTRLCDYAVSGQTSGTYNFKKGDIFKITNHNMSKWPNISGEQNPFKNGFFAFKDGNVEVKKDCAVNLFVKNEDDQSVTVYSDLVENLYYIVGSDGGNTFWEISQGKLMTKQDNGSYQVIVTFTNDGSKAQVKDKNNNVYGDNNGGYTDNIAKGTYLFTLKGKTLTYALIKPTQPNA